MNLFEFRFQAVAAIVLLFTGPSVAQDLPRPTLKVHQADDFEISGDGSAPAWRSVAWTALNRRDKDGHDYQTQVKMLYSKSGIYVLMDGEDQRLSAAMTGDFDNLWTEDVFEFFFWTDERWPVYFEYEISPLGRELPIIIPNFGGKFYGWRPWHYDGQRRTKKAIHIRGGQQKSGATIRGWRAEVFVPYELLNPLQNVPPGPGTRWRANFYRMDYDDDKRTSWDWARVGESFHEYKKFGTLIFQ